MKSSIKSRVRGQAHVSGLAVQPDTPERLKFTMTRRSILSPTCLQMMPTFEKDGFASQVSTNLLKEETKPFDWKSSISFRWWPPNLQLVLQSSHEVPVGTHS